MPPRDLDAETEQFLKDYDSGKITKKPERAIKTVPFPGPMGLPQQQEQPFTGKMASGLKDLPPWALPLAAGAASLVMPEAMPFAARIALEPALAGGAEWLNQAIGASPEDPKMIGVAAGVPGVARGAFGLKQLLPGPLTSAVQKTGAETIKKQVMSRVPSKQTVDALFNEAENSGVQFTMPKTVSALDKLIAKFDRLPELASPGDEFVQKLVSFRQKLQPTQGPATPLHPKEVQDILEGLGDRMSSMGKQGSMGRNSVEDTFASMLDDIGNVPGGEVLLGARQAFLRNQTAKEMSTVLDDAFKTIKGSGANTKFDATGAIRQIRKNKFYDKAFDPAERKEIEDTLLLLNKFPSNPGSTLERATQSVQRMAGGAAAGALAGQATGNTVASTAAGALLSAGLPTGAEMAKLISTAIALKSGRALFHELVEQQGSAWTPAVWNTMGAYVRAVTNEPDSRMLQEPQP